MIDRNRLFALRKKAFFLSLLAGLAALGLGMSATAQSASLTKVRYQETIRSLMFTPFYLAKAHGYFRGAGLKLDMTTGHGTDKVTAALLTGSVDIGLIGPEGVIYIANSESPKKLKIISGLVATDGFLLISRNTSLTPDTFKWRDLKGKRVMAYRQGSTPDVFLRTLLRQHQIDADNDLHLIDNIGPTARMGAWLNGQADFGIFSEPRASEIERKDKGRVVASDGNEVGQVDYTVFVATPGYINKHPQVVSAWITAISRGLHDAWNENLDDIAHDIGDFFPGLSQDELVQSLQRYRHYGIWKKSPEVGQAAIEKLQDMLVTQGILKAKNRVPYKQVVSSDLINWTP